MSAASPASSQVRHGAAAARAPAQAAARQAPMYSFVSSEVDEEFKLHLNDIPRFKESLDVEGLKPSFFSRLLEMVAPISKG